MIKKLRWRLVLVTMALLMVVMVAVIWMFIAFTYLGMKKDSLAALQNAGQYYGLHAEHPDGQPPKEPAGPMPDNELPDTDRKGEGLNKPNDPRDRDKPRSSGDFLADKSGRLPQAVIPCFVVGYDHEEQLYADGPGYYDLSDQEKLEQLVQLARDTGEESGLLSEHNLRFLQLDQVCGDAYAFTDVTSEMEAMMRLLSRSVLIGLLAIVGFFVICLLMSRWATRPVEQVMEQQRQFVADASHELKTPLTVILTNAELLEEDACSKEDRERTSKSILTMARQMRGLVEELLDLARVDNGIHPGQREQLNLSRLVEEQTLLFEPLYFEEGRGLESQVEDGLYIHGDPERLRQVVDILLDNGCKYSAVGSTVRLQMYRWGLKKCIISVESQGETLTRQECQDIFKRFYRRDPSRNMNHSYGLGLSIARTIAQQHKGEIWATSQEGVNTFYVRLPVEKQGKSEG